MLRFLFLWSLHDRGNVAACWHSSAIRSQLKTFTEDALIDQAKSILEILSKFIVWRRCKSHVIWNTYVFTMKMSSLHFHSHTNRRKPHFIRLCCAEIAANSLHCNQFFGFANQYQQLLQKPINKKAISNTIISMHL